MKATFLVSVLLLAVCSGCETRATRNPDSPAYRIPSGSKLVLERRITIPAGQAHVKMQHGKLVPAVDEYTVNCEFRVRDLGPRDVEPGTFRIIDASDGREWFSYPHVMRFYKVVRLSWDRPGNPPKLTCQYWDDPLWGRNLSVPQIREAVGDYLRFDFPGQQ
jgi:hypothetical protein